MIRGVIKNIGWLTIFQFALLALNFFLLPYYVKMVGIDGYGIYSLINRFLDYVILFQMGVAPTIVYFVSHLKSDVDEENARAIVAVGLSIQILAGCIIGLFFYFFRSEISCFFTSGDSVGKLMDGLIVGSLNLLVIMVTEVFFSILKGLNYFSIYSFLIFMRSLMSSVLILIFLYNGYDVVYMFVARLISASLVMVLSVLVVYYYARCLLRLGWFKFREVKCFFDFASWVVCSRFCRVFIASFPTVIVGRFVGVEGVGVYSIITQLMGVINSVLGNALQVFFPLVGKLSRNDNTVRNKIYMLANEVVSILTTPVFVLLVVYAGVVLEMWVGREVAGVGADPLRIMVVAYYLSSLTIIPSNFMLGTNNVKLLALVNIVQCFVMAAFVSFLVSRFGLMGGAVGIVVVEAVFVLSIVYFNRRIMVCDNVQFFLFDRVKYLGVCVLLSALALYWYNPLSLHEESILSFLIAISLVGGVQLVVSVLLSSKVIKDELIKIVRR
ncbi:oligosaccharide flippase family protein [Desulfovibrio mangrovi]|uniref:oligosaccharide flippase family protein n=1 Tax=Desulfovibrio mangrovi TaxID=2976983 RepID=UPI002245FFA8|nr:oligosaccharide flippase family protein [Desulfovibrio mangrovi]UZP67610.1 oligosaccharide flippase family protein [Desulfovibrio mangrovi]